MNIEQGMEKRERLRRPTPARTTPRRNILGIFFQHPGGRTTDPMQSTQNFEAHPLGLPTDEGSGQPEQFATNLERQDIQAAADLIDRHIRDGEKYTISTDHDMGTRLSALSGDIDAAKISEIASIVMANYSEVAAFWIELAGDIRGALKSRATSDGGARQAANTVASPPVCVQSDSRVSVKLQMFEACSEVRVQPLTSDTPGCSSMISEVDFADGQINIRVARGTEAGTYHGLMLSEDGRPVGAISLTILGTGLGDT